MTVRITHTADLDAADRAAIRALLDEAFDGDFGDADWEHSLGGMHAVARADGAVVGHAALVQRRLLTGGRALRTDMWRASPSGPVTAGAGSATR